MTTTKTTTKTTTAAGAAGTARLDRALASMVGWDDHSDCPEGREDDWETDGVSWETERDRALDLLRADDIEGGLRALVRAAAIESEWGATPSTDAVCEALRLHVEGGDVADDYDHGRVVSVSPSGDAEVAWTGSGETTATPIGLLREYDPALDARMHSARIAAQLAEQD